MIIAELFAAELLARLAWLLAGVVAEHWLPVTALAALAVLVAYLEHKLTHLWGLALMKFSSRGSADPWEGCGDLEPTRVELVSRVGVAIDRTRLEHVLRSSGSINPKSGVFLEYHISDRTRVVIAGINIDDVVRAITAEFENEVIVEPLGQADDLALRPPDSRVRKHGLVSRAFALRFIAGKPAQGIKDARDVVGKEDPLGGALRTLGTIPDATKGERIVVQLQCVPAAPASQQKLARLQKALMRNKRGRGRAHTSAIRWIVELLLPVVPHWVGKITIFVLDGLAPVERIETRESSRVLERLESGALYDYTIAVSAWVSRGKIEALESASRDYLSRFRRSGGSVTTSSLVWARDRVLYRVLRLRASARPTGEDVLTAGEVAGLWGPLGIESGVENRVTTSKATIKCNDLPKRGWVIARTNHEPKNQRQWIRISEAILALHGRILGGTGMGKSSLQVALAHALLGRRGDSKRPGLMVLDPKRSLVDAILAILPAHRAQDLVVIDPGNKRYLPPSMNLLVCPNWISPADLATVLSSVMAKRFADGWGARMAPLFHHGLLALILANKRLIEAGQSPRYTLFDLSGSAFLAPSDSAFAHRRAEVLSHLRDSDPECMSLVGYWEAFDGLSPREQETRVQPIVNKIAALDTPAIRALFGRPNCDLDFMDFLKGGKIVLVNLSKAVFKGDSGSIFGTFLLALVLQAAIVRYDRNCSLPQPRELRQFALLVDEVQNFVCPEMEEILNEGRAYACPLWIAHQETAQIRDASMRGAIENAGTHVFFRLTRTDARALGADLGPPFSREALSGTPKYNFLAITPDFRVTGETFPLPHGNFERSEKLREISESSYLRSRPRYLADKVSWRSTGEVHDGDAGDAPTDLPELPDDLEPEEPDNG